MTYCANGCGSKLTRDYPHICPLVNPKPGTIVPVPDPSKVIVSYPDDDENPQVRAFETGATRSADATRYDPEAFLSPLVIERYCEYMNKHRVQPDGSVRSGDNWQKGMPLDTYMKGHIRHTLHAWSRHRGLPVRDDKAAANLEEDLCAILFNVQGYLYEILKAKETK